MFYFLTPSKKEQKFNKIINFFIVLCIMVLNNKKWSKNIVQMKVPLDPP